MQQKNNIYISNEFILLKLKTYYKDMFDCLSFPLYYILLNARSPVGRFPVVGFWLRTGPPCSAQSQSSGLRPSAGSRCGEIKTNTISGFLL